jgi:sodium pump decarboxylase gamma subunit
MERILLATEPSLAFVCFFGVAIVFSGLVILIGLIYAMNYICGKVLNKESDKSVASASASAPAPTPVASAEIPNRGELVAAICSAIAEEEGTDISAIRVVSFKKIS